MNISKIIIRFVLISLLLVGVVFTLSGKLYFTSLFLGVLLILFFIEIFYSIYRSFSFYDKTLQAILNDDFTSDYSKIQAKNQYYDLIKVYEKLKNNQRELYSKEIIYNSILNGVDTGILILKRNGEDWDIPLLNNYFSSSLELPKVTKWSYLKNIVPKLCEFIENENFKDFKNTIQIKVKNQATQTYVVQLSNSKIYNDEFVIVLLESVQKLVDKKEKEAWVNLMKIISHELLNSLTPIQSLSQHIFETFETETAIEGETYDDIKQSSFTMFKRSNHLQQFVESYRKLAMLPTPNKKIITLQDLITNCINTMQKVLSKKGIKIVNKIDLNRRLVIDEQQIEQVIINLLTNSIYALEAQENKQIIIYSEIKSNRLLIHISDNGKGIDPEIADKIFLPFFTTRQGGGGIGLTLSKNILEAHNGHLIVSSETDLTTFTLAFLE